MKKCSPSLAIRENSNQNYIAISSHSSQHGSHQENKQQTLERIQGKGTLYFVGM
jgi:hypothetical protein